MKERFGEFEPYLLILIVTGGSVASIIGLALLNFKFNNANLARIAELKATASIRDAQTLQVLKELNENLIWSKHHTGKQDAEERARNG